MGDTKKTAKKPKPQKLSELKKVELLEDTVMHGSVQDVIDVYKMYKPFELTARALGLACRYRGIEYVKALVKCGARFKYKYDSALNRKYHMYDITCCGHYRTEYYLMLIPSQCPVAESLYGTNGFDYLGLEGLFEDNLLPIESRLEVLDYLAENKTKLGINMDQMLFYALMKEELVFADKLIEMGVNLDSEYPLYYSDYSSSTYLGTITMPDNSIYSQAYLKGSKSIPVLDRLCALTEPSGHRPALNHGCFENDFLDDEEKLAYAISHLDLSRVNKKKILEKAVKTDSVGALKILCESGWLNNAKTREELISYADTNKCKESLALLLDFKNKTVDVEAEEEKKQAKIMKELNEDPNSVSALKKIWSYKKLASGNLMITSYKGEAIHVEVPSVIGKSEVVMIGPQAFSDNKNGIVNADVRRRIESIVIPDSVAFIEERAFEGCSSLKSITIPDSVISIGRFAFRYCRSLTSITVPDGVTIIEDGVFWRCSSLVSITIPDNVTDIGSWAFYECSSLTSIVIPNRVTSIGSWAFDECSNLASIVIPDSVTSIGYSHLKSNAVSIHTKKGSAADKIFRGEPQIELVYDD